MPWVIDTCLLIDLAEDDSEFFEASARLVESKRAEGLVVCPITYVELAPVFEGHEESIHEFLQKLGVPWPEAWTVADTQTAFVAWMSYVKRKRGGQLPKRPIADVLIGAFAMRFQGLLTRNLQDFRALFPTLAIQTA